MKRKAYESDHEKNMHISVCLKGGALVSFAVNKNHRHSEVRAIKKARGSQIDTIINLRIKRKSGKIGLSYPCVKCQLAIQEVGIDKIWYSKEDGTFDTYKGYLDPELYGKDG